MTDASKATEHGDDSGVVVRCVWFFLPLPHPLGLPDHWTMGERLLPRELLAWKGPTSGLSCSLKVHQVPRTADLLLTDHADMWTAALSAIIQRPQSDVAADLALQAQEAGTEVPEGLSDRVITMIEASVPIDQPEFDADVLNNALDRAIDMIRYVQLCVAVVLERGVRLVSRATLPPLIPMFRGTLHLSPPRPPTFEEPFDFMVEGSGPLEAVGLRADALDDRQREALRQVVHEFGPRSPFSTYVDMRREAMTQRAFDGNRRFAVIALATAGEVLLDSMLLHLAWEERLRPEEAAKMFDRAEGHARRVARNFPQRLGDNWNPHGDGAVGTYFRRLVQLRHRVVHAGHEPAEGEMGAAWDALFALERFLGDRLSAPEVLSRYTRTATVWAGARGLRRRSRWTRRVQGALGDDREPNWNDSVSRYRLHVDRALDPNPSPPGQEPSKLVVYADKLRDSSIRWVVHDAPTAHAAEVNPHGLVPQEEIDRATSILARVTSDDLGDRRVMVRFHPAGDPLPLAWYPDHELLPELTMYPGPIG